MIALQIQIQPNTPWNPQILGFSVFFQYLRPPNVMPWVFPIIWVFGPYYSNIRIIFGPLNLTESNTEYHYSVPNYSNIRIIRTIRSNTAENNFHPSHVSDSCLLFGLFIV